MKTAKKTMLGVLAASVLALGLPMTAATADSSDTRHGGCFFNTDANQTVTQNENQGVIGVDAVMITPANTPDALAEIDCKIQVNTADAPGTEIDVKANAGGVVQGQQQIIFDDQGGTLPSALCENDISGDGSSSGWVCQGSTEVQIPPQVILDLIDTVFNTLDGLEVQFVDPVVCPLFQQLYTLTGGNVAGIVSIKPEGDVTINDPLGLIGPFYDCPPYGNLFPPA